MLNENYRRQRGTHRKFKTTPEEVAAEWARLYPESVDRARQRKARPKRRTPWADFSVEDD